MKPNLQSIKDLQTRRAELFPLATVAHWDVGRTFRLAILCWSVREVLTACELAYHADSVHVSPYER